MTNSFGQDCNASAKRRKMRRMWAATCTDISWYITRPLSVHPVSVAASASHYFGGYYLAAAAAAAAALPLFRLFPNISSSDGATDRTESERTNGTLSLSVGPSPAFLSPSVRPSARPPVLRIGQMTAAPWLHTHTHTHTHTRSTAAAATRRRAQKISPPDVDKLPQTMQPKPEREENCAIGLITAPSEAARPLWTSQGRPRGASDAFPAKCCAETSVFQSSQRANINFRQSLSRGAMT